MNKINGYDTVYGRLVPDREAETIDLLAEKRQKEQPSQVAEEDRARYATIAADEVERLGQRKTWDEFFFAMAQLTSTMATCPRASCGAVIVRHKRVIGLGFNGVESGRPHCPSEGEALVEHLKIDHCLESIHSEVNAIRNSVGNVYGATIYVYGHYRPCPPCEAELNRVGITDIRHRPGPRIGPDKNWG